MTDDQQAQKPSGNTRSRTSLWIIGAAVLLLGVAGVVTAIALTGDDEPQTVSTEPISGGTATSTSEPQTDVPPSVPPRTDSVAFDWQRSTLPVPEHMRANLIGLASTSNGLIAFGHAFDTEATSSEEARRMLVWGSDDGSSWQLIGTATGITPTAQIERIISHDGGFNAFGMMQDPDHPLRSLPVVFTSPDGLAWSEAALDFDKSPGEDVWLNEATAGSSGVLIGMSVSSGHREPEIVISKDGKTLVADPNQWTLTITNEAGNVLLEGTPERIWGVDTGSEFGLEIRDPNTGDVLFTIGWERLGMNPDEETEDGVWVYVEGEYRLLIDQFDGSFAVEDGVTGETLFAGTDEDLFRGPPPQFSDAEGNVVLSLTWRDVDRAFDRAWQNFEEQEGDFSSRPALLFSPDGTSFAEVELGDFSGVREANLNGLVAVEGGFTAMGELWTRFGEPRHTVWKSANGTAWNSFLPPEMPPYLHSLATFGGRYLAIGDDEQGPAVFSSADALVWTAALEAGESPNGFTWFNSLSTGDLGVLVVAESEGDHFGGAIGYVVLEDEVELAVEGGFVTVVALESSQILLEGSFDELVEQGLAENVDGVVRFYDEEASLLIEVRMDEISEALIPPDDGGGVEFEVRSTLYFSADGENFNVLVQPDELSGIYIHQTLVGSDYVVLAGEEMLMMEEMAGDDEEASATTQVAAAAPATIGHTPVFPGGDFIPQLVVVVGIPAS